jgi:alpha-glucosidase
VLITEADEPNIAELTKLYGNGDEVQLPMDFQIADLAQGEGPGWRAYSHAVGFFSAGRLYLFG